MKRLAIYHLETLLWIARLGTFRAAAERLNTTQPAISARVREIEEQLGVALFRREGRLMVLTSRGRELVRDVEPLWAGFETALMRASDFAGAAGVVRIGAGEIAAAACLPGFVRDVERDLPGVTLQVELALTVRMVEALAAGRSDIVFVAGPVALPGVTTAPIGKVTPVFVANPETAARWKSRPGPIWSLPPSSPLHAITRTTLDTAGLPTRTIATCDNVRTLIEFILTGTGAALLPETMIRTHLATGALVEILPRPSRTLSFEAAIRETERDPLVLELFRRAKALEIDPAG